MKNNRNRGFMLVEILIATIVCSSLLIFLFLQLTNLSNSYNSSQKYNNVQSLYYLKNIKEYIEFESNNQIITSIKSNSGPFFEFNCSSAKDSDYCNKLITISNVDKIIITTNDISTLDFSTMEDLELKKYINSISPRGTENYRLIARFSDETYATLRLEVSDEE